MITASAGRARACRQQASPNQRRARIRPDVLCCASASNQWARQAEVVQNSARPPHQRRRCRWLEGRVRRCGWRRWAAPQNTGMVEAAGDVSNALAPTSRWRPRQSVGRLVKKRRRGVAPVSVERASLIADVQSPALEDGRAFTRVDGSAEFSRPGRSSCTGRWPGKAVGNKAVTGRSAPGPRAGDIKSA